MVLEMEEVKFLMEKEIIMMDKLEKVKEMVMAYKYSKMVKNMKEIMKKTSDKALENTHIKMEITMKDNGKKINAMEKGRKFTRMVHIIKVHGEMTKNMGLVYYIKILN
jgi:hypothetical protein